MWSESPMTITEINKMTLQRKPRKKFAEDVRLRAHGSGGRNPPTIPPVPVYSLT